MSCNCKKDKELEALEKNAGTINLPGVLGRILKVFQTIGLGILLVILGIILVPVVIVAILYSYFATGEMKVNIPKKFVDHMMQNG